MKRLINFSLVRKVVKAMKKPDNEKGKQKKLLSIIRECERQLLQEAEFNCQYIERKRHEFIVTLAVYQATHYLVEVEHLPAFREVERKYRRTLIRVWAEYQTLAARPDTQGKITYWLDTHRANFILGKHFHGSANA